MNRRVFIKSVIALAMAKVSAVNAAELQLSVPAATPPTVSPRSFSPKALQEDDLYGTIIKVIGIGGAGCNAIEHAIQEGIRGVDFIVVDTDSDVLIHSSAPYKMLFGKTEQSAGADPEVGRAAADAHRKDIRTSLSGAHIAFIVAGMGGETGTGAASVVAEIAKDMKILTVGVVSKPFPFEGTERMKAAEVGITALAKHVDSLIVIPNYKLMAAMGDDADVDDCFKAADDVLKNAVSGIAEIITYPCLVAVDLEDVRAVTERRGSAAMGFASAAGLDRARLAAEQAVASYQRQDINLSRADGVLVNITAAKGNLKMKEINKVMNTVKGFIAADADIIFGAVYDEQMGDALRVTVVATGLGRAATGSYSRRTRNKVIDQLQQAGIDRYDIPEFLRLRVVS